MQLDPQKLAECRPWVARVEADLESSVILLAAARPHPDTALFHCQQAVEKAWKAFLFWNDVPFLARLMTCGSWAKPARA